MAKILKINYKLVCYYALGGIYSMYCNLYYSTNWEFT